VDAPNRARGKAPPDVAAAFPGRDYYGAGCGVKSF
jgi:hypothetical protein